MALGCPVRSAILGHLRVVLGILGYQAFKDWAYWVSWDTKEVIRIPGTVRGSTGQVCYFRFAS